MSRKACRLLVLAALKLDALSSEPTASSELHSRAFSNWVGSWSRTCGLILRDARRCCAPHYAGFRPILSSIVKRWVSKDETTTPENALDPDIRSFFDSVSVHLIIRQR